MSKRHTDMYVYLCACCGFLLLIFHLLHLWNKPTKEEEEEEMIVLYQLKWRNKNPFKFNGNSMLINFHSGTYTQYQLWGHTKFAAAKQKRNTCHSIMIMMVIHSKEIWSEATATMATMPPKTRIENSSHTYQFHIKNMLPNLHTRCALEMNGFQRRRCDAFNYGQNFAIEYEFRWRRCDNCKLWFLP